MIHGDDWKYGHQKNLRKNAIKALKSYGGKLIEVPYTKGISSEALGKIQSLGMATPFSRVGMLRRLLDIKKNHKVS